MPSYYIDTCVYLNLWQKEESKSGIKYWQIAKNLLEFIEEKNYTIYFSGFILKELNYILSKKEFENKKELFENIETVWMILGRQPFVAEMKKPLSKYSHITYQRRFGSWIKACEAFIKYKQKDIDFIKWVKVKSVSKSRSINEKTRLKVLKRDHYRCVKCGRSPASERGIILHIDHVKPFSKGGDSSIENLQTLCSKCNLGKNNDDNL